MSLRSRFGSAARAPAGDSPKAALASPPGALRLNKYLSERGVCSRRAADELIAAGRVTVNGAVAVLGTLAGPDDTVKVDGEPLGAPTRHVYLALHKPVGVECTTDTRVPENIVDFVKHHERIFPIGRLDKDSEGLILLTNDGDIVNLLLRGEEGHEKEYVVTVDRPVTAEFIAELRRGVRLPDLDAVTRPCRAWRVSTNVFRIVLTQGLNRQIRRMCELHGYTVRQLVRVRFVNILLSGLTVGRWRNLTADELRGLLPDRFGGAAGAATKRAPGPSPRPAPRPAPTQRRGGR